MNNNYEDVEFLKAEKYIMFDVIGKGSFGKVYRGIDVESKTLYAIKEVKFKGIL